MIVSCSSRSLAVMVLVGVAAVARADDLRQFCPDRPGLDTPSCTVDPGHVTVEMGGLDWTEEKDLDTRTGMLVAGDLLVRIGLNDSLEAKVGWTPYGHLRERDRATGAITRSSGTGDVSVSLQQNLSRPDGQGCSEAVPPYATLPTGGKAIGAGDRGAGVLVPISYGIADKASLIATPEIDAAVDEDRDGRHLAHGGVVGFNYQFGEKLTSALELQATRDDDPEGHSTETLASLSVAYQPQDGLQFDVGAVKGLNRDSPDIALYFGIARRFRDLSADHLRDPIGYQHARGSDPRLVEETTADGGFEIEFECLAARMTGLLHEAGCGIDRARRADRNEQVGGHQRRLDTLHPVRHLAEEDDIGAQRILSAVGAARPVDHIAGEPHARPAGAA